MDKRSEISRFTANKYLIRSESIWQGLCKDWDIYLCHVTDINLWSERSACVGPTILALFFLFLFILSKNKKTWYVYPRRKYIEKTLTFREGKTKNEKKKGVGFILTENSLTWWKSVFSSNFPKKNLTCVTASPLTSRT